LIPEGVPVPWESQPPESRRGENPYGVGFLTESQEPESHRSAPPPRGRGCRERATGAPGDATGERLPPRRRSSALPRRPVPGLVLASRRPLFWPDFAFCFGVRLPAFPPRHKRSLQREVLRHHVTEAIPPCAEEGTPEACRRPLLPSSWRTGWRTGPYALDRERTIDKSSNDRRLHREGLRRPYAKRKSSCKN
jgi:hypothetical protein